MVLTSTMHGLSLPSLPPFTVGTLLKFFFRLVFYYSHIRFRTFYYLIFMIDRNILFFILLTSLRTASRVICNALMSDAIEKWCDDKLSNVLNRWMVQWQRFRRDDLVFLFIGAAAASRYHCCMHIHLISIVCFFIKKLIKNANRIELPRAPDLVRCRISFSYSWISNECCYRLTIDIRCFDFKEWRYRQHNVGW